MPLLPQVVFLSLSAAETNPCLFFPPRPQWRELLAFTKCWQTSYVGGGARRCSLELKILRHLPPTWFYLCLTPSRSAFLQVAASAKLGGSSVGSGDWLPASFMGDLGCVSGLLVDRSWGVNQWSGCLLSLSISVPLKNNDNSNNQMASVFGF